MPSLAAAADEDDEIVWEDLQQGDATHEVSAASLQKTLATHCGVDVTEGAVAEAMYRILGRPSCSSLEEFRQVMRTWPSANMAHAAAVVLASQSHVQFGPVQMPTMFVSFLAGGISGVVAKTCIAPFERIKIMFQSSSMAYSHRNGLAMLKDIVKQEGPRGMFKGNLATVVRVLPYAGVQLMAYDELRGQLLTRYGGVASEHGERLSTSQKVLCGAGAGACSVLATYPLDLVRARLAVKRGSAHTIGSVFRTAWNERAMFSLYRGLSPTLLGILPYGGLAFATFETLKQVSHDRTGSPPSATERLIYGGVAGLVGQACVYPLDVVRRRLQTSGHVHGNNTEGLLATLRHVHLTEGARGLFKGMSLNIVKGPLAVGISFTVFDFLKKKWGIHKLSRH